MQFLDATGTLTRVAGASSMRDTVQRIIEANQYGPALHPPSPKFRLIGTSPICALPFLIKVMHSIH